MRRPQKLVAGFMCIALWGLSQFAQSRALGEANSVSDYVKVSWGVDAGLPQNSVKKVLQTRDGYIWVATQEGLARFDGVHFTLFNTQNSPGLESNNIHDIIEDGEGYLWIHANSGLSRYKAGDIENVTPLREKAGERIHYIWLGRDKHVYVASDDVFYRCEHGRLIRLFSSVRYLHTICWASFDLPGNITWCLTDHSKIYEFKGGKAIDHSFLPPRSDDIVTIAADNAGRVWAAGAGMYCFNGRRFYRYSNTEVFHNNKISAFTLDRNGVLWCQAGATVYALEGDRWVARLTVPGGTANPMRLGQDAMGNVCLWSQNGQTDSLFYENHGNFDKISVNEPIAVEAVIPFLRDTQGSLWIGTYAGLVCLKRTVCRTY